MLAASLFGMGRRFDGWNRETVEAMSEVIWLRFANSKIDLAATPSSAARQRRHSHRYLERRSRPVRGLIGSASGSKSTEDDYLGWFGP
jgi:hypothetical protein